MTYDKWKSTEPDPYDESRLKSYWSQTYCDCCGKRRPVSRVWAYGMETYACEECYDSAKDFEKEKGQ